MQSKAKNFIKILYYQRYLAWLLIIVGIPIFIFVEGKSSEMPLMFGLFTLFTSLEKIEDERSAQIKTTSLTVAFLLAYTFKLVSTTLFEHEWIPFQLVQINHFIILVLGLAIGFYNYGLHFTARKG